MNEQKSDFLFQQFGKEIKEKYISGMDEQRIMMLYRLSKEQWNDFLIRYVTYKDKKTRENNIEKFRSIRLKVDMRDERD